MNIRKSILSLAALLAVALFVNVPVFAQHAVRADIPFAFEAAGQTWQPGTYMVQAAMTNGVATLTAPDGRRVMLATSRGSNSANGELAFAFSKNAGSRVLSAVWMARSEPSYEFTKSKTRGQRLEIAAR